MQVFIAMLLLETKLEHELVIMMCSQRVKTRLVIMTVKHCKFKLLNQKVQVTVQLLTAN